MRFIKVADNNEAENLLLKEINSAINKCSNVFWLISGGSNVELATAVSKRLDPDNLAKLTISLIDERFGPPNHPDSNFEKLKVAGFDFLRVKTMPVLTPGELSLEQTAEKFEKEIENIFSTSDCVIGQIGIGADGHTAGILPHSPVVNEQSKMVVSYSWKDFQRISLSFVALKKLSKSLVFALGDDKVEALTNLHDKELSLEEQPAQIFKQIEEAYIINRIFGGSL